MNGAEMHLLVNHISVFCLVFGAIALGVAMKRKSGDLRMFASALFVIAGVAGWLTVESGESAETVVKALGGGTESFINEHADAATWALRSGFLVAILALGMEWVVCKKPSWARGLQWAVLIFAIHGSTVFIRTAFLGGLIRHTEIRDR